MSNAHIDWQPFSPNLSPIEHVVLPLMNSAQKLLSAKGKSVNDGTFELINCGLYPLF